MEEVDRILIQSLRDIGCQIDDSLQNVNEFDVNLLFACVSQCLQLITGNKDLPTRLPPNISTRFKVCGELAQLCQSNGYKGEIGYQTFLSINENETRKLLNFLIEKVPREIAVTVASTALDPWDALERALTNKITTELSNSTWIPHDLIVDLCQVTARHPAASFAHKSGFTPAHSSHISSLHIPPIAGKTKLSPTSSSFVFEQVSIEDLANSLMFENQVACWIEKQRESNYKIPSETRKHRLSKELCQKIEESDRLASNYEYSDRSDGKKRTNDDGLLTRSRFMHSNTSGGQENQVEENPKAKIDQAEELEELKQTISENEETIALLEGKLKKLEETIQKYEKFCAETKVEIDKMTEELTRKKQAANYLLNIDPETERLQGAIDKLRSKLTTLDDQWAEVRGNLVEQRENLVQTLNNRQAKLNEKLGEINEMKAKGRALMTEIKEKDEQLARLQQDYENHKKTTSKNDHSRTFFTKQIMEIVQNTNKQKEEINKTIIETRGLQKDLNRLTDKLERTFTVTDTRLFNDAKNDDCARRSYKMLVALHSDCDFIYKIVEEIGGTIREIRELEDQIEVESQKNMTTNLETLIGEYRKLRDENNALKSGKK